jgi:hypothetical protein
MHVADAVHMRERWFFAIVISLGVVASLADARGSSGLRQTRMRATVDDLREVGEAAKVYISQHPGTCPTPEDLTRAKLHPRTIDLWLSEIHIVCDDEGPVAISSGPDKQFDTDDDIELY